MSSKYSSLLACFVLAALLPAVCAAQSAGAQGDAVSYSRSFAHGVEEFDAGRYEEALDYQYGRAFAGAGLFDQAAEAFKLSARLRPGDAEVHLRLGLAYYRLGEFRDALDSLERAAQLAPDSEEAKEAYKRVAAEI